MKKGLAIVLSLLMLVSLFACTGGNTPSAAPTTDGGSNSKPSISGVQDATVEAGKAFDALAGVSATDAEDGDLTGMIVIESSPSLDFVGGKATPATAGSYELVYSVTDKAGETAEAYATLTVTKATGEAVLLKDFDFSTVEATDAKGWEVWIAESAKATAGMQEGGFAFVVEDPGEGDDNVLFHKVIDVKAGADYKVKIWAKSTVPTYAHFIANNPDAEGGWDPYAGMWNLWIEEGIKPLELNFTAEQDGKADVRLHMGKISPNPENPADTSAENFTVMIDKVEIYEITGAESLTPVFANDFASEGTYVEAGDGAAATVAFADNAAVVSIESYQTEGGIWSLKANLELPGVTIENGQKYHYSFKMLAENGQSGECLVESATRYHEARANFNGLSVPAGEEVTVEATFTAENNVEDPVIRMQIGNAPDGVTTNKLVIKDFTFDKVEGDKDVKKGMDVFAPIGKYADTIDKDVYPWETFNGTDEENEHGVGTIWTKDGSLFYRIDDGGTVDWHNKLICPITMPGDSYFIVELVGKATKPVSCGFFLNPQGGWDPRVAESLDFTTEEQTFTFETNDTFITDMPCELLFQFGSEATAQLGEVTIEISSLKIMQKTIL